MAARRVAFDGDALVAAIHATVHRRQTPLPHGEIIALTDQFTGDEHALATCAPSPAEISCVDSSRSPRSWPNSDRF